MTYVPDFEQFLKAGMTIEEYIERWLKIYPYMIQVPTPPDWDTFPTPVQNLIQAEIEKRLIARSIAKRLTL